MAEYRVILNPFQFVLDNLAGFGFDAVVILLYHFLHPVHAILVHKIGNDGYFFVVSGFPLHPLVIHDNFSMKNLLLDALIEVVGNGPHEHTLCER